jgi:hypothetical protein
MERCTWCGAEVETDDGFRAYEPLGERRAVFCRLEHVIPWSIQGAHWEVGEMTEPAALGEVVSQCSHCGAQLGDARVLLVHHRGEHRVTDAFCGVDHMSQWAKAGGRWQ